MVFFKSFGFLFLIYKKKKLQIMHKLIEMIDTT